MRIRGHRDRDRGRHDRRVVGVDKATESGMTGSFAELENTGDQDVQVVSVTESGLESLRTTRDGPRLRRRDDDAPDGGWADHSRRK